MKYLIRDMFTGENVEIHPGQMSSDGPSVEWVEGWNAYMDGGENENPYPEFSHEWFEWRTGYEDAERD